MDQEKRQGLLSVVLPSYNEEPSIPRAAEAVAKAVAAEAIRLGIARRPMQEEKE